MKIHTDKTLTVATMPENIFDVFGRIRDKFGAVPSIVCNDGFVFSVQNGPRHYCGPDSFEVGFPSEDVPALEPYRSSPGEEIFTSVPKDVVLDIIADHGGFAGFESY